MLGNFITRCLILILGYAYPGFECYKTVERNKVDFGELRFWCQYWIIVALFTVLEKFTDVFIGWLPLYGEMKLILFIYLWYPKTKGTGYVYDNVLRPYASKHENDIDMKFQEWRTMAWDLAIFYWQNCTELGQSATFQKKEKEGPNTLYLPSAPPLPEIRASIFENNQDKFKGKNRKWI
ncbi:hypothetical protein TanjilG_31111 [Lupinus angustifolius]|uniref:HVA22-like protein n=1 Tax=Lupinus angustifolius TaxID=3871 RepID=A0A394DE60_LUPAN|nr:hypothetical protein TanjilG_31111 [Lupinus angustifolius]